MSERFLFVTVGSTDFDPLIRAMDKVFPLLRGYSGIMQIGHGTYEPVSMPFVRFAPSLELYFAQASLVVAHGGLATTMEVLERGLPLVSVSNTDRYDNHQDDLLQALAAEEYLTWCRDLEDLKQSIEVAETKPATPYIVPECQIPQQIASYLQSQ